MIRKAAIFDIDGTLSPEVSWTELTHRLGTSVEEHLRIFGKYRRGEITYEDSRIQLISLWRSTGNAHRKNFMTIFNSFSLRPAAVPLVGRLEANGFEICIITGSFDLYAEVVAAKLGVKNYYGNTTLYFDADDVVQSYDYYGDQSAKKVEQFKSFCEDRHITPNNCYAVGNGDGDIGLFSLTGHGILLRQDGQSTYLKDTARKTVDRLGQVTDTIEP